MAIIDLFSTRQQRLRGEVPDVTTHDSLPQPLRVQIINIIRGGFGQDYYRGNTAKNLYKEIKDILCNEYGIHDFPWYSNSDAESLFKFFEQEDSVERALDVVDICFKAINGYIRNNFEYKGCTCERTDPDEAIAELNARFKQHGVGYQFESNEIIRVDSELLHAEVVKPVLSLLRAEGFEGPNEEFLNAHEHYRHGRHKECLNDALKSFESTMMTIASRRGWDVPPGSTAKTLIDKCFEKNLVPKSLTLHFTSLRSLLESGIVTIRNRTSGHGQGPEPVDVPEYIVRLGLNLTASCILFLVEADSANS